MRKFDTGATRDTDEGKLDYEGFLSPVVLRRFCEYMNRHRVQADGQVRASDNWQKGIPVDEYFKSLARHFFELWEMRRVDGDSPEAVEKACAIMFNIQGYLFECLREDKNR